MLGGGSFWTCVVLCTFTSELNKSVIWPWDYTGGYVVNKVKKVVLKNKCETKQFKNCTGVIETNVERVCFNVNELVCSLVEAVHYETLEEMYQVQRCFTGKDRVCDTTYDIDTTTKDDYQSCNVETPNCFMEEKTINDVTCTNTVRENIKKVHPAKACETGSLGQ